MSRVVSVAFGLAVVAVWAPAAAACPYCESDVGREVAAQIFNNEFAINAAMTVLPFPLLLGLVAAVHFGGAPAGAAAHQSDDGRSIQERGR